MKKVIAVILSIALLIAFQSTVFAEDFSFRNGIHFGDSMETVLARENLEIDKIVDTRDEYSDEELPYYITTTETEIAGIDGTNIVYEFNSDGVLRSIKYSFTGDKSRELMDSRYSTLYEALVRKYGQALGLENGDIYIFTGSTFKTIAFLMDLVASVEGIGDIRNYDEWVVDCDDYHVKIEIVEYYVGMSYSNIDYSIQIGYTYFTDSDLQAAQTEQQEQRDAADRDL